jgi:aspartyl-tRNA(Asn)/glutamyl-tRNA(Gln) amidotransferase subunit C
VSVSREDVLRVAALARLRLTDREAVELRDELAAILEHVERLEQADLADDSGSSRVIEWTVAWAPRPEPDILRVPLSEVAPGWRDGLFVVPRLPALGDPDDGRGL